MELWIGVSDIGTEDFYTYLSDNKPVDFTCQGTLGGSAAGKTKKNYVKSVWTRMSLCI